MLRKRMLRVRAQSALGVIAVLLGALLDAAALVVDVARRLAGLGVRLLLWLGGLAAGVGGGHVGYVCVGGLWLGLGWVLGMGGCGGNGGMEGEDEGGVRCRFVDSSSINVSTSVISRSSSPSSTYL